MGTPVPSLDSSEWVNQPRLLQWVAKLGRLRSAVTSRCFSAPAPTIPWLLEKIWRRSINPSDASGGRVPGTRPQALQLPLLWAPLIWRNDTEVKTKRQSRGSVVRLLNCLVVSNPLSVQIDAWIVKVFAYYVLCAGKKKRVRPVKKLLPILCVLCKAHFCRVFFFWKCHGSSWTLENIYSFIQFPPHWWKTLQSMCWTVKRPSQINVTPIMDLYSQNKFEKLISIFKVQYNPKENVDTRELAYISSLFHAVFFSELPFFLM